MRSTSTLLLAVLLTAPAFAQENPITDGIVLWLRADAGVAIDGSNRVESWQDQSDRGFVFSHVDGVSEDRKPLLGQGVLNGQNVVRFDGIDDFLSAGDVLDDVFTGPDRQFEAIMVSDIASGSSSSLLSTSWPSSGQREMRIGIFDSRQYMETIFSGSSAFRDGIGDSVVVGQPRVLTYSYDGTADTNNGLDRFAFRVDGYDQEESLAASRGSLLDIQGGSAHVSIGASVSSDGLNAGSFANGDIAELLVYNRILNTGERRQVEVYLGTKYGIDVVGVAVEDGAGLPESHSLSSVYPNPFDLRATVRLEIGQAQQVRVAVHDVLGRELVVLHEGFLSVNEHTFTFSSEGLSNGIYIVRVVGERFTDTRQAVVLR